MSNIEVKIQIDVADLQTKFSTLKSNIAGATSELRKLAKHAASGGSNSNPDHAER